MTQSEVRRKYKNPPIEEALVEFRFPQSQEWDLTIPGKLHQHDKIRNEYIGKPRQQRWVMPAPQQQSSISPSLITHERVQLINADATKLISIGPHSLSINGLRPYEGWDSFRARIELALQAYSEVLGNSKKVNRIGVRYINKIVIPEISFAFDTFFQIGPYTAQGFPTQVSGFQSIVQYTYESEHKLTLTHATQEAPEGFSAFLLDFDVVWESNIPLSIDNVMTKVDDLHKREGIAFESTITDETRKIFDAE